MIAGFFISITSDAKKLYREPTSHCCVGRMSYRIFW